MLLTVTTVSLTLFSLAQACLPPPPSPPPPPPPPSPPVVGNCRCGTSSLTKIVGGESAGVGEFPWQVGLVSNYGSTPFCGGTLLSSNTVLTAAHCQTPVSNFKVVVGEFDVSRADGEQRISPSQWIQHPNYNSGTTNNDFAIIKLATPVSFSSTVNPACLPTAGRNYDNVVATVSGWGTLSSGGRQPSILQKVGTL